MNALVNGTTLAAQLVAKLREKVAARHSSPTLAIISIDPDFATLKYLAIKERVAAKVGISLQLRTLSRDITTEAVLDVLQQLSETSDGVVLQLPFPSLVDTSRLLKVLPVLKDPDAIGDEAIQFASSGREIVQSPVVAAILHIADSYHITFAQKRIVIVGRGRLVGAPMERYLRAHGMVPYVHTKDDGNVAPHLADADIVILGAGVPGLVHGNMLKEGAVVFDAGASEEGGKLVGDADQDCTLRASLITPVPGGIGPLAVTKLFENLMILSE